MSDKWEELRGILEIRRGLMQKEAEKGDKPIHQCAVLTFDYVLDEMKQIEGGEPSSEARL